MGAPLFEKKYSDYVTIYKIPIGPNQLDPLVFYFSEIGEAPALQPSIHSQITRDLEEFTSNQPQRVKNYYLVGNCVKPGPRSRKGPLTVLVEINKDLLDFDVDGLDSERILDFLNSISGKLAVGTCKKINYKLTVRPINLEEHEGIYDIPRHVWVKIPNGLRH